MISWRVDARNARSHQEFATRRIRAEASARRGSHGYLVIGFWGRSQPRNAERRRGKIERPETPQDVRRSAREDRGGAASQVGQSARFKETEIAAGIPNPLRDIPKSTTTEDTEEYEATESS
jgi:hypothetical protein